MKKYNVQFTTTVTETFVVEAECDLEALDRASEMEDEKPAKRRVERNSVVSAVEGFTVN